jgi:hypothetical protein
LVRTSVPLISNLLLVQNYNEILAALVI